MLYDPKLDHFPQEVTLTQLNFPQYLNPPYLTMWPHFLSCPMSCLHCHHPACSLTTSHNQYSTYPPQNISNCHLNFSLINVNAELSSYLCANIIEHRKSTAGWLAGDLSPLDPTLLLSPSAHTLYYNIHYISLCALVKQQLHGSDSLAINSHLGYLPTIHQRNCCARAFI